jgi:hypothetical protein
MRKDIKKKENTFNLLIIILMLFSSTGVLQLVFLKNIKNSKNIINVEEKFTKIEQYNLATNNNIEGKNFNNFDMVKVITEIYLKNQSFEIGDYTEEESKNDLLKNKNFEENNKFSKSKFLNYLKKISGDINLNIDTYDYITFNKDTLRKNTFNDLINIYLSKSKFTEVFKNSIKYNSKKVITGYKITIPVSINDKTFTKKEINKFIFEEKLKKNIHYTIPEKRSGYIITVKLSGSSQVLIQAIDYFLKHKEFNEEKLKKFLITYGIKTNNFMKTSNIEHKGALELSNNIDINSQEYKDFKLDNYINISIFSNVTFNEDTKLLFKKEFNKTFVLTGDEYSKVNVTEITKSKEVDVTPEFHKNFLLPAMEAVYIHDSQLEYYYNQVINHNSKKINLLTGNFIKTSIKINDEDMNYLHVVYSKKNDGIILYDVHSNPFIFIVENIFFVDNETSKINEYKFNSYIDNELNNFIKKGMFTMIFYTAYDKLKTSVAH